MCLVYDGFKDLYKVFANGEKLDSGSWSGDNPMEIARCLLFLFNQSRTSKLNQQERWNSVFGSETGRNRWRVHCQRGVVRSVDNDGVTIALTLVPRQAEPVQHLELAAGGLLPRERCRVSLRPHGQHGGVADRGLDHRT